MKYTTDAVFICQFFNTGFLLMLCNANLTEQSGLLSMFDGTDSDFNQNWFSSIGDTIVGSMMFNIYFPIAMEFVWFAMRSVYRLKDKAGAGESGTNCKTIQQYVNIQCGPQYFMHFKYSAILNICFMTMMFGVGLPILFPVAAASFGVLFCLENFMLYYVFKQPPAYDERLNDSVLANLTWAPLFMLGFGYWMLTNQQLMQSYTDLELKKNQEDTFLSGHYWYSALTPAGTFKSGPAGILVLVFLAYFIYLVSRDLVHLCIKKCCSGLKLFMEDVNVDEAIDEYQNCLDDDDRQWTVAEEENSRKFGMMTMLNHSLEEIKESKMTKGMHLQGVHTYNILRNPAYITAFQYISADTPDRADYIIDDDDDDINNCAQSDLTRIALNLAFLS
jgi:hypothetical protein